MITTTNFDLCKFICAFIFVLVGPWGLTLDAQEVDGLLYVELREPVQQFGTGTLVVGDFAILTGGSAALRAKAASLDLEQLNQSQKSVEIKSEQVMYRLMLAGISRQEFLMTGKSEIIAKLKPEFSSNSSIQSSNRNGDSSLRGTQERLEESLAIQIASKFGLDSGKLVVRLDGASAKTLSKLDIDPDFCLIEGGIGIDVPVGAVRLQTQLRERSGEVVRSNLSVNVSVLRDLVIAKRNISKGELFDDDNVQHVSRPVSDKNVRFASYAQAIGKSATGDIQQYSVVRIQNVAAPSTQRLRPDVSRNKIVTALVAVGSLKVELKNARTVTEGRIGETIEIINPNSKKRMVAVVIDSNTVEVR